MANWCSWKPDLRKVQPIYPFAAKKQGLTGEVVVRCLIQPEGRATHIRVVASEPDGVFDEATIRAIEKWRFKPGILGGDPVPTWVRIPLKFELN